MITSNPPTPTPTIVRADKLPSIAFIEARFYRRGKRRAKPLWVVIHATHGAEGTGKARDGATELATLPDTAVKRSAHAIIDTADVVQCVPWECEAWHAGAHANRYGEGIELCGSADQTRDQWFDAASLPMLGLAAHVVRWRCEALAVPMVARTADELRKFIPGITTHAEIAKAFPADTTHYDPGPHFPLAELLAAASETR